MPPWSEVLGFVHVSTYSSWNELGKWYWGLVQDQLDLDAETRSQIERDAIYANYIHRQEQDVDALKRDEAHVIPVDFRFDLVDGLSNELKQKLCASRPANIAQANRIDGMTPAALALILSRIRKIKRVARG